ncbi:MAG TPA: efflux RND transporter periplasmic adaptor subunit [Cellvibrionaceae bacterium]
MNNKSELLSQLRIDREDEPEASAKWPWFVGVAVFLLALVLGFWLLSSPDPVSVDIQRARVVSNNSAGASVLDATGYVTARRYATVSSKVTAKVMEVMVEEGMEVEEGQIVALLDDSNTRKNLALEEAGLALAQAQLAETRTRLEEAERSKSRVEEMFRRELVSESDLDVVNSNFMSLQAQLDARKAQVLSAQRRVELQQQFLDDMTLRAPFSGVVISKDAQPGEMISPVSAGGGFTRTGICSLVDMQSLEIEVDVNESYIERVKAGQPVVATLEAYPDWKIPARVIAIVPTADRQKATVRVRVGFEQLDPRILPQMGVKVAFLEEAATSATADDTRQGIVIPAGAIVRRDDKTWVFVVEGGLTELRAITVQARNSREYWVEAGLAPAEQYVVNPPPQLQAGVAVISE